MPADLVFDDIGSEFLLRNVELGTDRFDQQVLQLGVDHRIAEHVIDLLAVDLPLLFDLFEQPTKHLTLTGFVGNEVPQVAVAGLADAVDTAESLLDPVRVPRQVVVDHQVRDLQVDALASRIGGDQNLHRRIGPEPVLDDTAVMSFDPAMDRDNCVWSAQFISDALMQIVEGVFVFREHDEFARSVITPKILRTQHAPQLCPFRVDT